MLGEKLRRGPLFPNKLSVEPASDGTKDFKMKKLLIFALLYLSASAVCFADSGSKPVVKKLKPLFIQGTVDSVVANGLNMTDTHQKKKGFNVFKPAIIYDIDGKGIILSDLHPNDRVKVLFRIENPDNAVAVYRIPCLTKAEKAAYAAAHQQPGIIKARVN
jgi:hypothetical protein